MGWSALAERDAVGSDGAAPGDLDGLIDGDRKAETARVVGVVADQVDAARRSGDDVDLGPLHRQQYSAAPPHCANC